MITSAELAWIVSDATSLGYEAVQTHIRQLRDGAVIKPTGRGRGATPLDYKDAARVTLACLASDLAKDSTETVSALDKLLLHSTSREASDALVGAKAMDRQSLLQLPENHSFVAAFETAIDALSRDAFFVTLKNGAVRERETLLVEVESRFWMGRFRPQRASIQFGINGIYQIKMGYVPPDFAEDVSASDERGVWVRDPIRPWLGASQRIDRYGLRILHEIASRFAAASDQREMRIRD